MKIADLFKVTAEALSDVFSPPPFYYDAIKELADLEGLCFAGNVDDEVRFVDLNERRYLILDKEDLQTLVPQYRQYRELFIAMRDSGAEEIDVPRGVRFDPFSKCYSESLDRPPASWFGRQRVTSIVTAIDTQGESASIYYATKSRIKTQDAINSWDKFLEQVDVALASPASTPAAPVLDLSVIPRALAAAQARPA